MNRSTVYSLFGQVVNSALMFAIIIGAAHLSSPGELGIWSLAVAVWTIGTMVNRAVVVTGALVAEADRVSPLSRERTEAGLLASVLVGIGGAVAIGLLAVFGARNMFAELMIFALGIAAYLPYDTIRFRLGQLDRSLAAAVMEASRGVLLVAVIWCSSIFVFPSLITLAAAFLCANVVLLACAMILVRSVPRWGSFKWMFSAEWSRYSLLLLEAALNSIGANSPVILATVIVGPAEGGAARIAFTVAGGMGVLLTAILPASTLHFVRALKAGENLWKLYLGWSSAVSAFGAIYGIVILFLPERVGNLIGGESWGAASLLILPVALELCLRGPLNGAPLSLRSALAFKSVVVLRVSSSVLIIFATCVGAYWAGLNGLFWGFVAAQTAVSVLGTGMVASKSFGRLAN